MRKFKGQKGLSLVEVTIMLLVLMLLTSVLAPSIFDFVNDAKWVKVKEDCEAIGITFTRLTRDVGNCLLSNTAAPGGCNLTNKVDILFSDGAYDGANPPLVAGSAANPFNGANVEGASMNWDDAFTPTVGDSMEDQFTTNAPLYSTPSVVYPAPSYPAGPLFGIGWRGAYLSAPIGPDPWGFNYMVNAVFHSVANNATAGGEGGLHMGWERDVFCISPGPNGQYQTFFGGCDGAGGDPAGFGTCREGDDFVYVISGGNR